MVGNAVLTCTHNICFSKNMKVVQKIQLKIVIFTAVKNRCILHERVSVMYHGPFFTLTQIL